MTDPYVLDIVRIIFFVNPVKVVPCCSYPEDVCASYYDAMQDMIGSYEEFRKDVRAAELLETAALAYGCTSVAQITEQDKLFAAFIITRAEQLANQL